MKKITKLLTILVILCASFLSGSAYAADWYVSNSSSGGVLGTDAVTSGTTSGTPFLTVKYAIADTRVQADAAAIIRIADGTYTENNITITKTLTLQGASKTGTIIQAQATQYGSSTTIPVFSNLGGTSAKTVTINDLTIQNGYKGGSGGGLIAPTNTGYLTLNMTNVWFKGNYASGTNAYGGAIRLEGLFYTTLTNCEFSLNKTAGTNSGGGAIFMNPTNANSYLTLSGCYFHDNFSTAGGGGAIIAPSPTSPITLTIDKCTFSANYTSGNGGAIMLSAANTSGANSVTIKNTTLYSNYLTASAKLGGAIYYSASAFLGSTLTLNHTTIVKNSTNAGAGGDGVCINSGASTATKLVINNSIIMGNYNNYPTNTTTTWQVGTNAASQANIVTTGSSGSTVSNSILGVYDNSWGVNNQATTNDYDYNNKTNAAIADLAFAGSLSANATPVLTIGNASIARNYVTTNKLGSPITTDQIGQSRVNATDAGAYENQVIQYNIAATAGTGGTITSGTGNYDVSSSCTLVATPASGYAFESWTEGGSPVIGASASYTFTVSASRTLVANFVSTGTPTVLVSGSTLTDLIYAPGAGPSTEKSFTVSGTNLRGDIIITAPAHYEISTGTEGSFVATSPITLAKDGSGAVSSTTINVRLKAGLSTATAYNNETITISSTDVTDQTVTCSGRVLATVPTLQASNASASNVLHTTANLSWTAGDGTKTLVLFSTNASDLSTYPPVGGTTYTVGSTTHAGCIVGYVGTGNSANISGLTAGTTNYFAVFTFNDNGSGGFENYLISAPATASATTIIASNTNDYFQTTTSGNWATTSIWNSSSDNSSWHLASLAPGAAANTVTITAAGSPITATADILAPGFTMQDGTKFIWNAAVDFGTSGTKKAIKGTGVVNFDAVSSSPSLTTSNYFINFAPSGTATTTINVGLGNAAQSGTTTFNWNGVSQSNYPAGVQLNVTNNTSGTARIQIPRDALTDRKLHLGSGIAITRGDGAGGIYFLGLLNGDAGSFLEGENSGAEITYTIGSLNTDCEFAGSFRQFDDNAAKGNASLNKVGSAKLKLSGTSSNKGTVTVTAGTLEVTGALNGTGTVTVASGATLKGTGTIAGLTTVNGTIEGSLHIGAGGLVLAGTTNFVVTGFNSGEYNAITVDGAVSNGGVLNITLPTSAPEVGTSIKLINASGVYSGTFSSKTLPSGYTYNDVTGYLTYEGTTVNSDVTLTTIPSNGTVTVNSGLLTIDQNAALNTLTIAPGAKVTLNSGRTLTAGTMTLQGDATTGSGTFLDPSGAATVTATVQQTMSGTSSTIQRGWWYVSSPVSNATAAVFIPNGSTNKFGYWNEPTFSYPQILVADNITALAVGKGYVFNNIGGDAAINFSGTLNTGDKTIYPTRTGTTNGARGFNLVGNPYPSYLNWNAATKVKVRNTIWYRTWSKGVSGGMTFDTYDGLVGTGNGINGTVSNLIPPMQGFWVKVNADGDSESNGASITFHNNDRSHQTTSTNLLRTKASDLTLPGIVRLRVSNGQNSDETILVSDVNASDAADSYDSPKMKNNNVEIPEIFTLAGTEELVINHLNSISANQELTLGFRPGKTGDFSISANELSNLDPDIRVILKDNEQLGEYDLTDGTAYAFNSGVTETTSRFSIIFKSANGTTGQQIPNSNKVLVSCNDKNQLTIQVNGEISSNCEVAVYNSIGQKMISEQLTANKHVFDTVLCSGVYVVALNNGGQKLIKKVVIK